MDPRVGVCVNRSRKVFRMLVTTLVGVFVWTQDLNLGRTHPVPGGDGPVFLRPVSPPRSRSTPEVQGRVHRGRCARRSGREG